MPWSGCSTSTGRSGPVCEPGATPATDDASISSRPAPLALAGAGPTQVRTGTSRLATRSARATPSRPSAPGVSSWSTITAPARSASARRSSTNASKGRSIGPWTSITCTRVVGGAAAADAAGPAGARHPTTATTSENARRRPIGRASYRPRDGAYPERNLMAVDTGHRPGPPPLGGRPGRRGPRDPRAVRDRVSFKPIAVLLLVPIILATSVLAAVVLAPPFAAVGFGVNEVKSRLDALGADFTRIPRFPERSTIYASDGSVLARVYLDNREIVPLKAISPIAREAVLAIEDSDFFAHGALDWSSLIRAMIENARAGEVVQGGSTITQQLVGSALGANRFDQSIEGKLQELALSIRVERRYPKSKIFEMYLNEVYMGNGVYGFGTAAQFYFRKPARELNLIEGATLAGMIRAPEYYDPLDRPKKMLLRRNDVLNRMRALGWITESQAEKAKAKPLSLPKKAGRTIRKHPPFFVKYLTDQIIANTSGEFDVLGTTEKARRRSLYEGGLQIHTTLQPKWQRWAQDAARQPPRVGS